MPSLFPRFRAAPQPPARPADLFPVPRSSSEVSELLTKLYPSVRGPGGLLIRYRPYIAPFERVLARIPPGGEVLDVGCGVGMLSTLAAATGLASRVRGFDTSAKAIARGTAAALPVPAGPVQLERLAVDKWPDGTFDVVLCVDVLHHVPPAAQEEFVARVCRSVRPGGRVIFKDIAPRPRWKAFANRLHDLLLARQWVNYCEPDEVARWLAGNGLGVVESGRWDMLWYGHYFALAVRPARARRDPLHRGVQEAT